MDAEMEFFIYLLEHYAEHKKTSADIVLAQWDAAGLTDTICRMYPQYHVEAIENAFDDIDALLAGAANASR